MPGTCLTFLHNDPNLPRTGALRSKMNSATLKNPLFMKSRLGSFLAVSALIAVLAVPATTRAKSDSEQICVSVGRLLEEGHYTHQQLNDDMSKKILRSYLELLDFSHLFFT